MTDHGSKAHAKMVDKLLTVEQKVSVIQERIRLSGKVTGSYVLKYDTKFGFDFAVRRKEDSEGVVTPIVTFAIPITHRRFQSVLEECIQAIEDVREGRRKFVARGDGPFAERNLLES